MNAALSEFAQVGFEAASIRNIAAITGLQHPLITYHYRTKEILWQAVAEDAFTQIRRLWDEGIPDQENMTAVERLRAEYSAFLRFTIAYPDFHHFMLRESRPGNPRLPWLVETALLPLIRRLLPQIEEAQEQGALPPGNPGLIHYMLIGMMSVLSSLKDEIRESTGIETDDPEIIESYLSMVDTMVFPSIGLLHGKEPEAKVKPKAGRAGSGPKAKGK
ncbi:TetR/AcrR family transcriptional regulator [Sphingobium sp. EM0848]|uniref:TetR/AcrR family transcriptional regulator n=1 Tax=Sphingobium sp. EM0848 TaxID=2743473 RepID=UPI00159BFDE4|nr:TetR/AcrR family transcriptional regulator [Sphingobium sp. EM0848]